jgi:hypothetical protein
MRRQRHASTAWYSKGSLAIWSIQNPSAILAFSQYLFRMKTSDRLVVGQVYTRADLSRMFDTHDATLNTGHFRLKGSDSVWIFVTENKTSDRTQYNDELIGDDLYTDGQTQGRQTSSSWTLDLLE